MVVEQVAHVLAVHTLIENPQPAVRPLLAEHRRRVAPGIPAHKAHEAFHRRERDGRHVQGRVKDAPGHRLAAVLRGRLALDEAGVGHQIVFIGRDSGLPRLFFEVDIFPVGNRDDFFGDEGRLRGDHAVRGGEDAAKHPVIFIRRVKRQLQARLRALLPGTAHEGGVEDIFGESGIGLIRVRIGARLFQPDEGVFRPLQPCQRRQIINAKEVDANRGVRANVEVPVLVRPFDLVLHARGLEKLLERRDDGALHIFVGVANDGSANRHLAAVGVVDEGHDGRPRFPFAHTPDNGHNRGVRHDIFVLRRGGFDRDLTDRLRTCGLSGRRIPGHLCSLCKQP